MTRCRAAIAFGVWLLVVGGLWATDSRPAAVGLAAIVLTVAAVLLVAFDLLASVGTVEWGRVSATEGSLNRQLGDRWARTLRSELERARRHESTDLSERLVELVDDRLRARRIDRHVDEELAMRALSPALRRLVTEVHPIRALREAEQLVAEIEAL